MASTKTAFVGAASSGWTASSHPKPSPVSFVWPVNSYHCRLR
ncbi:MAG TPA: hypothetical protein VFZ09_31185 [Archangium sp.]|nr:hypothetical protein [Archangium sp.]HEX5750731.1 hypothetical protein [Archangium sp.]